MVCLNGKCTWKIPILMQCLPHSVLCHFWFSMCYDIRKTTIFWRGTLVWHTEQVISLVWTSFTSALLAKWHHLYSYLSVSDTLFFISKIWTLLMWLLTPIIAAMCFPSEVFGAGSWCFFSGVFILMWPNIWDQFWGIGFLNSQS